MQNVIQAGGVINEIVISGAKDKFFLMNCFGGSFNRSDAALPRQLIEVTAASGLTRSAPG